MFNEIRDSTCAEVKLRLGSLVLHLGATLPSGLTEWRIFIDSAWRLDGADGALAGSADCFPEGDARSREAEASAKLQLLVGTALRSAETLGPAGDLALVFSEGLLLSTFSDSVEGFGWEIRRASGARIAQASPGEVKEWTARPDWEV